MENKAKENNEHKISPMTILVLLALFVVIIAVLVVSTSCSTEQKTGTVTFTHGVSRDLFASIGYPDANSLLWDITATKLSKGSKAGEGVISDVLLTDEFGPFSTGHWEFTLVGKDGETAVYEGSTTAYIVEGANLLEVTVDPIGETGTLVFSGCNFPFDNTSGAEYTGVQIYVDGVMTFGVGRNYCEQNANGMWVVPQQSTQLEAGLHDVSVLLGGNEPVTVETFKVRIVGGLTTTVTFGTFEGSTGIVVSVNRLEAIEE